MLNYNTVYAKKHGGVLREWFGVHTLFPDLIYQYNANSAFVYDLYDIETGDAWCAPRVCSHVVSDDRSRIYINLSSENCTPTPAAMAKYTDFIEQLTVPNHRITVLCSQQDVLDYVAQGWGTQSQLVNFWETHTALVLRNNRYTLEPTHRISCLNRRYTPERATAIHALWPHIQNVYYTLGAGAGWHEVEHAEYQLDEWQGYDTHTRDTVLHWQNTQQPWQDLNHTVDHTEWDTGHLCTAQGRGSVALVVESRTRTRMTERPAFVTEKTYRCFGMGIPAIVIGHPNIRQTLADQGYALPEYRDAVQYAVQLASTNDKQFRKQLKQLQRIAEHNLRNFHSRTAAKR